jgi:hypothetical protein
MNPLFNGQFFCFFGQIRRHVELLAIKVNLKQLYAHTAAESPVPLYRNGIKLS